MAKSQNERNLADGHPCPRPTHLGAPVEVINVDVEIDATDQLEQGDTTAVSMGIHPQLAALELLVYPKSRDITQREALLARGTIEVAPLAAPRTLFV